jgi:hypothetical protein
MFVRTFCLLNLDSRLKLLDPGGRTMIANLNWNVTLQSTPPMEFSTQAPTSRRRRSDFYFILPLCLPVPIHGWISEFKSTTEAMIVMATRTELRAVAAEIEAAQTEALAR